MKFHKKKINKLEDIKDSKYKSNLFFEKILQLESEFKNDFDNIAKKCYLMFFSSDAAVEFLDYIEDDKIINDLKNNVSENKLLVQSEQYIDSDKNLNNQLKEEKDKEDISLLDVKFLKIKKKLFRFRSIKITLSTSR